MISYTSTEFAENHHQVMQQVQDGATVQIIDAGVVIAVITRPSSESRSSDPEELAPWDRSEGTPDFGGWPRPPRTTPFAQMPAGFLTVGDEGGWGLPAMPPTDAELERMRVSREREEPSDNGDPQDR